MRDHLMYRAPWWVLALVSGGWFWIFMAVTSGLSPSYGWPAAILGGLVGGVVFGVLVATSVIWTRRRRRQATQSDGSSPDPRPSQSR
ncbi:hypothetical protein Kfla_2061 [Kribbella flavida DSM 17836]|uniref:Uncharacterized protein n=1 Tax=Kribbella flavida (strain DSM 17836 / JCM 10339 / NBRC 14399) TaxID=479435 RepID=D2PS22_KRIFD|nr:hypothetical protein Kfla_2061 [Kribbella flavida DSM 17836]